MTARTYRLPAADRTGWLLGLGGAQVIPLAVGLAGTVVVVARGGSASLGLVPFILGVAVAFTRVAGLPALEAAPAALTFVLRRQRRRFEVPLPFPAEYLVLPEAFGDVEILDADRGAATAAVVIDRSTGLASATLRVTSPVSFLLCDEAEQVRFLDNFGAALAPLCRERGPVVSLRWVSFAAPAGRIAEGRVEGPAAGSYRQVLDLLAGEARHDVLLTLTVRSTSRRSGRETLISTLFDETDLLADRLAAAGLEATVIDGQELGIALRQRLDPAGRGSPAAVATLPRGPGLENAAGPLCVDEGWKHLRIDATTHRCYHVVEWPRSEIPPAWTADLLLALPVPRTICVVLEPVTPRVSRRWVQRQAARLDSDEEQRRRMGLRVGADHSAARDDLLDRERELVAGHPEFEASGFVVLSEEDPATLDELEAQARSVAAAAGVELAACHGRHAASFSLVLPVPFGSARGMR